MLLPKICKWLNAYFLQELVPEPGAGAGARARAVEKKPGAGQKRTGFATLYKVYMDQEPTFCYDWSDTVLCMRKT